MPWPLWRAELVKGARSLRHGLWHHAVRLEPRRGRLWERSKPRCPDFVWEALDTYLLSDARSGWACRFPKIRRQFHRAAPATLVLSLAPCWTHAGNASQPASSRPWDCPLVGCHDAGNPPSSCPTSAAVRPTEPRALVGCVWVPGRPLTTPFRSCAHPATRVLRLARRCTRVIAPAGRCRPAARCRLPAPRISKD